MPKDTTQNGQVGLPTRTTLTDTLDTSKKGEYATAHNYIDQATEVGDNFDDMVSKGLAPFVAQDLRRISHGLDSLREITQLLHTFSAERNMCDADLEGRDRFTLLSPRGTEGLTRGVIVLAELLGDEVYRLGDRLVVQAAKGGAK